MRYRYKKRKEAARQRFRNRKDLFRKGRLPVIRARLFIRMLDLRVNQG
jgi:hypothetical protein